MMGYFTSILPLVIFVTLSKMSNSQARLSIEIDTNEKKALTETEKEMLKQLSSHPHFIYSELMESSFNSAIKENVSAECLLDTRQVIGDLLAGKQYSVMSKFFFRKQCYKNHCEITLF